MRLSYIANFFIVLVVTQVVAVYAQTARNPLGVIVQAAAVQELKNDIEALGNLRSNESTVLTAKTTKTVTHINFEDGQRVSKGATLVEMANNEEAALMEEANYNVIEAKKQLERVKSLSATGAVPAALLDQYQRDYETSRAQSKALDARLKDLRIIAPFNGVLGIRNISVGSLITPGQEIVTLNDDSKMKLDFTVPAVYLRSLRVGLPIEASSHDLEHKAFKGVIASVDNQIDEATRSIKVRALVENSQYELKQGMLMNVVIYASSRRALAISEAALVPMGSNNFVFVLQRDTAEKAAGLKQKEEKQSEGKSNEGKNIQWLAEKRQITIGKRYTGRVEVLKGLLEGDKVVTHGLQKIHDGQVVSILAEQNNDPNKPTESLSELLSQKKQ